MNVLMKRSIMAMGVIILAMASVFGAGCRSETNMEFSFDLLPALE